MSLQNAGQSVLRAAGRRLESTRAAGRSRPGVRVPLSSLRARLDGGSAGVEWTLHPDGVLGRALRMDAETQISYPLTLTSDVSFATRVMLLPHDWRDGRGTIRAAVTVTSGQGTSRELWSGLLRASDRGRPRGHRIHCEIPAASTLLTLRLRTVGDVRTGSVTRAIWLEPAITDPHTTDISASRAVAPPGSPAQPPSSGDGPLISVLIPVHDPPLPMLEEAIASVRDQTFTSWELCLVDDGSQDPQITAALRRHADSDPRIHLARHEHAGGIATATNRALEFATGQYIALLDHDDTLTADALHHVAQRIATNPELDMLYSDEDILGEDGPIDRHPKPGWSPEHLTSVMYSCHLGVYRRSLADSIGGFRSRFDGCQDYDFIMRMSERTDQVAHIPRVLYHWRAHARSTASGEEAKPFAYLAQAGAISEHLSRTGIEAEVLFGQHPGMHRIVHRVDPYTSVDLVLAFHTTDGLAEAAASWLAQPHPTWQIVLAAPSNLHDTLTTILTTTGIPAERITLVNADDLDPTRALNTAAQAGRSQHLLLMQTPAMGLTHDWLTRLIGYSHQPGIAAAGPILLAPDGRIQQAGIAMPNGTPLHHLHGAHARAAQPVVYNVAAVSGILATPRATFQQLGGLHPDHHELALIDYCLRATTQDQRLVIIPDARLRTTGPDPTTNDLPALHALRHTWAHTHHHDPYYNPNYRTDRGDFILA